MEDQRIISKEKAEEFKNNWDLYLFMEVSQKENKTDEILTEAAIILYNDYQKYKLPINKESLSINKNKNQKCYIF